MPRATRSERTRASAGSSSSPEQQVLEGYKIKLALEKLWKTWETAYRDPLKAHVGTLTAKILEVAGQVKLVLVEKFAHDESNAQRIKEDFLRCLRGNMIRQDEILSMLESGVLSVSTGTPTVSLLCARLSTQPADYVVRANTDVPIRTELRWDPVGEGRIQLDVDSLMGILREGINSQASPVTEESGMVPARRARRAQGQ